MIKAPELLEENLFSKELLGTWLKRYQNEANFLNWVIINDSSNMNDSNMHILMECEPTGQPTDEFLINHVLEISSGLEGSFKSFIS